MLGQPELSFNTLYTQLYVIFLVFRHIVDVDDIVLGRGAGIGA